MKENLDRNDFIELLKDLFPESYEELLPLDEDELLHLEMGDFARTTCTAIENNKHHLVEAHFHFISELIDRANHDLWNAICVSYLEDIFLDGDTGAMKNLQGYISARTLLPDNLEKELQNLEEYFRKIFAEQDAT